MKVYSSILLKPRNNKGVTTISHVNHLSQPFVLRLLFSQFNLWICSPGGQTGKSTMFLYSCLDHRGISSTTFELISKITAWIKNYLSIIMNMNRSIELQQKRHWIERRLGYFAMVSSYVR